MAASLQTSSSKAIFTGRLLGTVEVQMSAMASHHRQYQCKRCTNHGTVLCFSAISKETPKAYPCGAVVIQLCMLHSSHPQDSGLRDSVPSGVHPRRRLPAKPGSHCMPTQSRQPVKAVHVPGHQ